MQGPTDVKKLYEIEKFNIVMFTCEVTRALDLKLVTNMKTAFFLLAFRQSLAQRGNFKIIYSDNAKTFMKATKEFEDLYETYF